jgi:23S rRNA pseudouridine1911/1915/1917 synthase
MIDDLADDDDVGPAKSAFFELPPGADPAVDWGLTSHLDGDGRPRIIERHLVVPPDLAGLRLDHFVKTQIGRLSRTKIQTIIETQLTRIDGRVLKASTSVAAGDHYVIRRPAPQEPPCPRTFTVVYEDARVRVIDKPALLPVHASAKFYFNTLTRVMAERYPDEPDQQIVHRLDRETSGCLVIARDKEAAAILKQAWEHKTIKSAGQPASGVDKQYLAVVHGTPPWTTELLLDIGLRLSQPSDPTRLPHVRMLPDPAGQSAMTKVRTERAGELYSLVRCSLLTGRQHQIRAHLAHAGFPIVGDKLYAHGDDAFIEYCDKGLLPALAALFVLPRHALHAAKVTFPHPDGGTIVAEAPLPPDLAALVG